MMEEHEHDAYIAGRHAVIAALKAGTPLHKIWMAEQVRGHIAGELLELAKQQGVTVQRADRRKLDTMVSQVPHQGIVAQAAAQSYCDWPDLLQAAEDKGEVPLLLILDGIEDPHNLGAMLRTADAVGAHGLIIAKRRSAGLTPAVHKASAGAAAYVPVARVSNIAEVLERLKEAGVWIAGADGDADQTVYEADLRGALAVVVGNEGKGLSRLVRQRCDFLIKLPMRGQVSSLNASVAASLLLYEALRQREG